MNTRPWTVNRIGSGPSRCQTAIFLAGVLVRDHLLCGAESPQPLGLTLPPAMYAVPGIEMSLYYDNVVLTETPDVFQFQVICDLGKAERKTLDCVSDSCRCGRKDEWMLDDYRAVGKGNGRGEIKVVPSPSYIDFNLYWYVKSFEIGNNQGVYWDNFFVVPSFNTEMTDAYGPHRRHRRAGGRYLGAARPRQTDVHHDA